MVAIYAKAKSIEREYDMKDQLKVEGVNCKGFGIIPKAVMLDLELSIEAKTIYSYFCSLAGNGTTAFPGRDTIINHLKISKEYYYKNFNQLTEQGFVKVERVGEFPYKNVYTLINNPKKYQDKELSYNKPYSQIKYCGLKVHGFGTIPRIIMIDDRLNIKAKGIYSYFCSYARSGIAAFPKVGNILYHLRIGRQAYYKYYNQLVSCNYITVMQRKIEGGKFSVSDYYLNENPDIEEQFKVEKQCYKQVPPSDDWQDNVQGIENEGFSPSDDLRYNDRRYDDIRYDDRRYDDGQDSTINKSTINNLNKNNQSINLGQIEGLRDSEISEIVFKEIWEAKQLPNWYKTDYRRIAAAIHVMTDWNKFYPCGFKNKFKQSVYELFNEALIDMCCADEPMRLKGSLVDNDRIINKLNQYIEFIHMDLPEDKIISISTIQEAATYDFEQAAAVTEIQNHLQYMKACIWSALQVGNIDIESAIKRDFPHKEQ